MDTRLPIEFTDRMGVQLGESYDDFIRSYEQPAYRALRLNRQKVLPVDDALMCRIATGSDTCEAVGGVDGAYRYTEGSPGKSPLHAAGAYYIQEPSAMYPVTLLDIDEDVHKVLDLCAAPGGKTTQIADKMRGRGLLVANEVIPSRAKILSGNIERMGIENALVINEDPEVLSERFPLYFDRILVDAPCSGEGMFRKNPEAVDQWSPDNVKMCAKRQDFLLDCAVSMLSVGGRIVYSTCTFSPEEDEECVDRFLMRHPEFTVCAGPKKLYPHDFRGEGQFMVAFARAGGSPVPAVSPVPNSQVPGRAEYTLLCEFLAETLRKDCAIANTIRNEKDRLAGFGDSLYLLPEICPDLKGIKVLRAGLKIGTYKRGRFEPDHALSHALKKDDAKIVIDLDPQGKEALQYLSGMTVSCDASVKGICLVCAAGIPLGWGKAVGGIVKNHYPKGLRILS